MEEEEDHSGHVRPEDIEEAERKVLQCLQLKDKAGTLSLSNLRLRRLPPATWGLHFITSLNLSNCFLRHVPPQISSLTNLEVLDMRFNDLTTLPPEFGALRKLRTAFLSQNKLRSFPGKALSHLHSLSYFSLYENQLEELPWQVGLLTKLTTLWLYNNRLSSLPLTLLSLKDSLQNFSIHVNPCHYGSAHSIMLSAHQSNARAAASSANYLEFLADESGYGAAAASQSSEQQENESANAARLQKLLNCKRATLPTLVDLCCAAAKKELLRRCKELKEAEEGEKEEEEDETEKEKGDKGEETEAKKQPYVDQWQVSAKELSSDEEALFIDEVTKLSLPLELKEKLITDGKELCWRCRTIICGHITHDCLFKCNFMKEVVRMHTRCCYRCFIALMSLSAEAISSSATMMSPSALVPSVRRNNHTLLFTAALPLC
ncbi:hypothetical protein QOT17_012183 [Balamuthia mandrillaris]